MLQLRKINKWEGCRQKAALPFSLHPPSTSSPQPQPPKSIPSKPINKTDQHPPTPNPIQKTALQGLRLAYCPHPSCNQFCSVTLHFLLANLCCTRILTSTNPMACTMCRVRAWSRRVLQSISERRPRRAAAAPVLPLEQRDHEPPPPYPSEPLDPLASPKSLRARTMMDVHMPLPPPPMATLRQAADAAAYCATLGTLHALTGERPEEVAARTVEAITVAVSTSRSYGAFVAATAAAQSVASICAEDPIGCGDWPPEVIVRRVRNDAHDAINHALGPNAAKHAWPLIFDDDNFHMSSSRPRSSSRRRSSSPRRNPFPTGGFSSFEPGPAPPNTVLNVTNLVMSLCQQPT